MSVSLSSSDVVRPLTCTPREEGGTGAFESAIQMVAAFLVPLQLLWAFRPWLAPESERLAFRSTRPSLRILLKSVRFLSILPLFPLWLLCVVVGPGIRPFLLICLTGISLLSLFFGMAMAVLFGFPANPETPATLSPLTWGVLVNAMFRALFGGLQSQSSVLLFDWMFFRSFEKVPKDLRPFERALKLRIRLERSIYSLIGTLFVIGFSLLPLSALLVMLPAVAPNEAVLSDSVRPAQSWFARTRRRVFAVFAGIIVLLGIFGFSIEAVSRMPLPDTGQLGALSKKILGFTLLDLFLPEMMLEKAPKDLPEGKIFYTSSELIEKRDSYLDVQTKQNRNIEEQREAAAKLAEIEKEIEEEKSKRPRLQIMLDPTLARWLAKPIWTFLPPALVQHWPFVFLCVYATDLALLLLIGRVPLAYNFRYLWVRRRDTALTALAFTVVVAIVIVLLAFVNGMYKLNEGTGIPGNVMVLADGSTDELFSNLGYSELGNVEKELVTEDEKNRPIAKPYRVARGVIGPDGVLVQMPPDTTAEKEPPGTVRLASFESYLVMNQAVAQGEGEKPKRRFLQVRALKSPAISAAVHNMSVYPGGKWFAENGVHQDSGAKYIPCMLGDGVAGTLGADIGKPRLQPGDTFTLGDKEWIVLGILKSEGTTFGSEIWCSAENNPVIQSMGKGNKFTTLVLRMANNTEPEARAMAYHLQNRYTQAKLKVYSEPAYYQERTKTNEQFLSWIVFFAAVMAVGGVFGVMNTMFASIAARIKEVGVLRILGFKRWQILISFMLESLTIAFVGGAVGCMLGFLANGFEANSTLSGGGGGVSQSVALKMIVDYQTIAAGLLFTLVMGRLGGLVPALSAMRMEILDSLR